MTRGAAKMRKTLLCVALVLMTIAAAPSQAEACADVAIVFAIDGSDSITDAEYAFETRAIVSALRDESVLAVLKSAGMVAVSAVIWGYSVFPVQRIGWFFIDEGRGAETFAREIERNQRAVAGNTDIGNGIWQALDLLDDPGLCPLRSVIDISRRQGGFGGSPAEPGFALSRTSACRTNARNDQRAGDIGR